MYTRKQRICAFLICTIFIMVALFSTLFIVRADIKAAWNRKDGTGIMDSCTRAV